MRVATIEVQDADERPRIHIRSGKITCTKTAPQDVSETSFRPASALRATLDRRSDRSFFRTEGQPSPNLGRVDPVRKRAVQWFGSLGRTPPDGASDIRKIIAAGSLWWRLRRPRHLYEAQAPIKGRILCIARITMCSPSVGTTICCVGRGMQCSSRVSLEIRRAA